MRMKEQSTSGPDPVGMERRVHQRYARASRAREEALCCPTEVEVRYLEVIPEEILQRDYGCGDPSRFARRGDVVLDLGSGSGKGAFILSQVVGAEGRVIGIDFQDEMLALARRHRGPIGDRIGWRNVEFRKGRIQDLALDLDRVDAWLAEHPARGSDDLMALQDREDAWRRAQPLVPDGSVDLVVSNCVFNLVRTEEKEALFREMFRVLRRGGRVAISDIVSDREVPASLQSDPELWSGCISGAFQENAFLRAFEAAGFHGIRLVARSAQPFATVDGIDFRSVTVTAHKGEDAASVEGRRAVVYRGPYRGVEDDHGQVFRRGVRAAVSSATFRRLGGDPYGEDFILLDAGDGLEPDHDETLDRRRGAPRERQGVRVAGSEDGGGPPAAKCC